MRLLDLREPLRRNVHLAGYDQMGAGRELGVECLELRLQDRHILGRVPVLRCEVRKEEEHRGPAHVPQELMSEPPALARSGSSPGMSATTKLSSPTFTTPRLGARVVNG